MSAAQQGYQAAERDRQRQLVTAEQQAAKDAAAAHPPVGSTTLEPTGQRAPDGRPLYKRVSDGQIVFDDNTPYAPTRRDSASTPGAPGTLEDALAAIRRASQNQRLGL